MLNRSINTLLADAFVHVCYLKCLNSPSKSEVGPVLCEEVLWCIPKLLFVNSAIEPREDLFYFEFMDEDFQDIP
ncbi:hypothetical protein NC652_004885 [Populus alba x Populus x berolinensis]|nr:hypothetical protein NC652_004885 [Populus alba x Populus x berolinensis]